MSAEKNKKFDSLRQNRDFTIAFKKGQCIVTWGFVCYIKQNNKGLNRCGIVCGKKIGNAVKRNRAKRVIMAAFRRFELLVSEKTTKKYDFVFVGRGKTPFVKSHKIYALMKKQILDKLS
ncbi:MAG: ribonuclease P protein component [Clostridiales bacterium]|nr:ribonuclease P protein component [Clostridiales bacterium]